MILKTPFFITDLGRIDLEHDRKWVPDGENMWFLPCVLDFVNNCYSGYWYGTKNSFEEEHAHTGITHGTVLRGEVLLFCNGEKSVIKQNESFLLPPHILHSAELNIGPEGFLFFGIVVGSSNYVNHDVHDVASYYAEVSKYYLAHGVSLDKVIVNR